MRKLALVLACLFFVSHAQAQNLSNLPPNTVVGRLGAGVAGQAQAIPFATFATQIAPFINVTPGSPTTSIQYNNGGVFGGVSGVTSNGTAITFGSGDLKLAGSSSGSTILQPAATASGTISLPAVTDTVAVLGTADQALSGGANLTVTALSTGNVTIDCGKGPGQYIANTGAFTITAPSNDGECVVQIENGSGAGAVTFTGFSEGSNTGDSLTTVNGNKFQVSIVRIHSISHYLISALQ